MKILRKITQWLLRLLAGILFLIILYFLSAIILTLIPVNSNFKENSSGTDVFISSNGVHTNIIIPFTSSQYNWARKLSLKNEYKYLAFGWGDKEFYMNTPSWSELKISTAFKAAFLPSPAVVQVYGLNSVPGLSKNTKKIRLSEQQLHTLAYYIYHSLSLDKNDDPVKVQAAVAGTGFYTYFEAKGKYTLFFTCNNWTNRGLKQAGIKNSVWAPFDRSVLYHLK